jgi:ferric-dicitrate binding protein FerR (iron transport regulator)
MKIEEIDKIMAAELNGSATEADKATLEQWKKESTRNEEVYTNITSFFATKYHDVEIINEEERRDEIWKRAHAPVVPMPHFRWMKYAAAVVLLCLSGVLAWQVYQENTRVEVASVQTIVKQTVAGVKSTVQLPDGSKVVLNSSSKIEFADGFRDSVRWVKLEGEAYFDVSKNPHKPFIVQSGSILTRALGTGFNVKIQPSGKVDVALVEGSVEVKPVSASKNKDHIILSPGEYVAFEGQEITEKGNFDYVSAIGWKDGLLTFNNADFQQVVGKLEQWYGVTFKVEGRPSKWSLNGTYDNDNLENILKALSHSENFNYNISGNQITIKFND